MRPPTPSWMPWREHRRAEGLVATSVAWGPWDGGGMATGAGELLRRGLREMTPELAMPLWGRRSTAMRPVDGGGRRLGAVRPDVRCGRPSPLLDDLPEVRRALAGAGVDAGTGAGCGTGRGWRAGPAAGRLCPRASRTGCCTWSGPCRRRARPRLARGSRGRSGRSGAWVRLADRGGVARPAERGQRAAAAGHAGVRPPHPSALASLLRSRLAGMPGVVPAMPAVACGLRGASRSRSWA